MNWVPFAQAGVAAVVAFSLFWLQVQRRRFALKEKLEILRLARDLELSRPPAATAQVERLLAEEFAPPRPEEPINKLEDFKRSLAAGLLVGLVSIVFTGDERLRSAIMYGIGGASGAFVWFARRWAWDD